MGKKKKILGTKNEDEEFRPILTAIDAFGRSVPFGSLRRKWRRNWPPCVMKGKNQDRIFIRQFQSVHCCLFSRVWKQTALFPFVLGLKWRNSGGKRPRRSRLIYLCEFCPDLPWFAISPVAHLNATRDFSFLEIREIFRKGENRKPLRDFSASHATHFLSFHFLKFCFSLRNSRSPLGLYIKLFICIASDKSFSCALSFRPE